MRSSLALVAALVMSLSLAHPAYATDLPAGSAVGDRVNLGTGSPAPLSVHDAEAAGQASVVNDRGVVVASSLDAYAGAAEVHLTSDGQPMGLGACNPVTGADKPHLSSSEDVASAHGWWRRGTCSGNKAAVRACLLEWWRGKDGTSKWVTKKCKTATVKPAKKGSRKPSVTVRVGCTSLRETGWANLVDVDVSGEWDNGESGYMTDNVFCRREP